MIDTIIKTRVYNNIKNDIHIITKLNNNQLNALINALKAVEESERLEILTNIVDKIINDNIPHSASYVLLNFRKDLQKISDMSQ